MQVITRILVKCRFVADRPGQLWVADITQHPTDEEWLYIAAVVDAFSRRVVGWSTGERATAELVAQSLDMAIHNCEPGSALVYHSDHGTQFTPDRFARALRESGILSSIGTVGDAYDNALAESFWALMLSNFVCGFGQSSLDKQVAGQSLFDWPRSLCFW